MKDKYIHSLDSNSRKFIEFMDRMILFMELFLRFRIVGIENIPVSGPGIIVMNHSALPIDGMLLVARFMKDKGRQIRPLIHKNLRKHNTLLRKSVLMWGGVDANAANALQLLRNGELLLIYPGGPKEAIKDNQSRYKLIWGNEAGFVKLALLTGAPVIPVASIGLDENLHLISDGTLINRLLFGKDAFLLPIVRPSYILPKRVSLHVGEPITFSYPPDAARDTALIQKLQRQVKDVLENMISQYI